MQAEAAYAALDARGWDATRARVRTAVPASDETAPTEFVPLATVAGDAAFTALPVPPELAGNADGDVVMDPPVVDDASDGEGAAADADAEETAEERARRLDRERKKRKCDKQTLLFCAVFSFSFTTIPHLLLLLFLFAPSRRREEQTALADDAVRKEAAGEELTEPERTALVARRAETARSAARRRHGGDDE